MRYSKDYKLEGYVGDPLWDCELWLFVDADFCGEILHTKSTSGCWLVLTGPNTSFPIAWCGGKQGSTARSTTEAELISLAMGFFKVSLPILDLFDFILKSLGKPPMHIRIFEDNQSTIKVMSNGWSVNLCSSGRVHKVNIGSLHDQFFGKPEKDRYAHIGYCTTNDQRADIFTKALEPQKLSLIHI